MADNGMGKVSVEEIKTQMVGKGGLSNYGGDPLKSIKMTTPIKK